MSLWLVDRLCSAAFPAEDVWLWPAFEAGVVVNWASGLVAKLISGVPAGATIPRPCFWRHEPAVDGVARCTRGWGCCMPRWGCVSDLVDASVVVLERASPYEGVETWNGMATLVLSVRDLVGGPGIDTRVLLRESDVLIADMDFLQEVVVWRSWECLI